MTRDLVDAWLADVTSRGAGRTRYEGQEPRTDEAVAAEIVRLRARENLLLAVKDAAREVYDKGGTVESEWNALGYVLDAFEKWEKANE